jgi:hypothetical protein
MRSMSGDFLLAILPSPFSDFHVSFASARRLSIPPAAVRPSISTFGCKALNILIKVCYTPLCLSNPIPARIRPFFLPNVQTLRRSDGQTILARLNPFLSIFLPTPTP